MKALLKFKSPLNQSLFFLALVMGLNAPANSVDLKQAQRLEVLMGQWINTQKQVEGLEVDWRYQRQAMEQRLDLLNVEESSLNRAIKKHTVSGSESEQKRLQLTQQQHNLELSQDQTQQQLEKLEQSLRSMQSRLPEPLKNELEKHFNENKSKQKTQDSNSQKLATYLAILEKLTSFQSRIAQHQTIMKLDGNVEILAQQYYVGLSQGWFVSSDGKTAGYGYSSKEGWVWQLDNRIAPLIKPLKRSLSQPKNPELVSLPFYLLSTKQQ